MLEKQQQPRKPDSIAHLVGKTKVQSPDREVDFQTDVDNLMKAIQAKQPKKEENNNNKSPSPSHSARSPITQDGRYGFGTPPYHNGWPHTPQQHPQQMGSPPEIHQSSSSPTMGTNKILTTREAGSPTEGKKDELKKVRQKKRYECLVPGCGKSFFQKTHLDIHSRAHTGDKPFVRLPWPHPFIGMNESGADFFLVCRNAVNPAVDNGFLN
jgi:hypothetical protein